MDATAAATAAVAAAMAKLPQPGGGSKKPQGDASIENVTRKMNDLRPYDNARRGGQRGGAARGGARNQHKKIDVPESDYDFETANAKFNKQDLVKEAIASGSPAAEVDALATEPDSGDSVANVAHPSVPNLYNRSTSFFDNISSEARDREENNTARAGGREWRGEEEKRNIETFGQGSVDGYRGRGRGRGYGRGYGRGRGQGGRGYGGRGRGGMRGRGNSHATGVPSLG
ncbi:Lsm14 N-terminal [Penicillium chermesinum]|nr:Lsm14 N-terminal [Penicillium chermesinum]